MHVFCEQMTLDTSQILCERFGRRFEEAPRAENKPLRAKTTAADSERDARSENALCKRRKSRPRMEEERAGGALSSANDDDGGGFTARCASREQTSAGVGRRPLVVGGVMSETGFLFREVRRRH
jgi:hypothetical protein